MISLEKINIIWFKENDLAQIFLNSLEKNKTELQKFITEHEIRF